MRGWLADIALKFAEGAQRRAERTKDGRWRIRWVRRSMFWSDLRIWISGLGKWSDLRQASARRLARTAGIYVIHQARRPS